MGVDTIHVLTDGKVQEQGTHKELMEGRALIPYPEENDSIVGDTQSGGKIYQRMWQNFILYGCTGFEAEFQNGLAEFIW